jgi:lipoic acid synthetase
MSDRSDSGPESGRLPPWIRVRVHTGKNREMVHGLVDDLGLNTVCQSAKCPNIAECWHQKAATLMILGDRCTRACQFCAIKSFKPNPVEPDEPARVAEAVAKMDLRYVVLTSVDRDDLPDKGAGHWCQTIQAVRERNPGIGIEILTPDFKGREALVKQVVDMRPVVYNHNMETCERLTKDIRSGNRYERSLQVLSWAREHGGDDVAVKSGIMVGLGETDAEVETTLRDMYDAGVQILTIGQYLKPSREHWPVHRYVEPAQFDAWAELAHEIGFAAVASSPMVRSSYKSEELARQALGDARLNALMSAATPA